MVSSQTIHTYKPLWLIWVVIYEAHFGFHDIPILGKSLIKWSQRSDMTLGVDWDVKRQIIQSECLRASMFNREVHAYNYDKDMNFIVINCFYMYFRGFNISTLVSELTC